MADEADMELEVVVELGLIEAVVRRPSRWAALVIRFDEEAHVRSWSLTSFREQDVIVFADVAAAMPVPSTSSDRRVRRSVDVSQLPMRRRRELLLLSTVQVLQL
jgi:hypothetical protein